MISNLPFYINIVFILTTGLTVFLFYKATQRSVTTLVILGSWLLIQAVLSFTGFYTVTDTIPPRFALLALPALLFIIFLFITPTGKNFINSLDIKMLTLLHIVRIPVEICLYWLFLHKSIPQLMTFEGRNFDIMAGLTAPVVYYFGFVKPIFSKTFLLFWNIICLGLVLNIVVHAVLSAPSAFQQFAFEQPNTAIFYFPFVWLPCCVVPLVLLAHFAAIRKLTLRN
ncbi:MAG: hypothetical protein IPH68_12045 [Chitinophagaceae bacterium]|nr:hypothetical protein [Chitinophagaceae bacterium]